MVKYVKFHENFNSPICTSFEINGSIAQNMKFISLLYQSRVTRSGTMTIEILSLLPIPVEKSYATLTLYHGTHKIL